MNKFSFLQSRTSSQATNADDDDGGAAFTVQPRQPSQPSSPVKRHGPPTLRPANSNKFRTTISINGDDNTSSIDDFKEPVRQPREPSFNRSSPARQKMGSAASRQKVKMKVCCLIIDHVDLNTIECTF